MTLGIGTVIRAARRARNLTQAELAEGIVDASYLSLIEAGKRIPSAEVLEAFERRLGVQLRAGTDVDAAAELAANAQLAAVRAMLHQGLYAQAVAAVEEAALIDVADTRRRPHWIWLAALGSEETGDLDASIRVLPEAIRMFRSHGEMAAATEATIDLVRCLRERGDWSQALDVAKRVLDDLPEELHGSLLHAKLCSTVIGIHYRRGDFGTAQMLAEDALQQFPGGKRDNGQRAVVLWNAALTAEANGNVGGALLLGEEAVAVAAGAVGVASAMSGGRRILGQLRTNVAWLMMRATPVDVAAVETQLDLAEAEYAAAGGGTALDQTNLLTHRAQLALIRGNAESAVELAREAISALDAARDSVQVAHSRVIAAQAFAAIGDLEQARAETRAAEMSLDAAGPSRANAVAWRELAEAFEAVGSKADAMRAMKRALDDMGVHGTTVIDSAERRHL